MIDKIIGSHLENNAVGPSMSENLESFNYLSRLKVVTQTLFGRKPEANDS